MTSKAHLLDALANHRVAEVEADLAAKPELLDLRDPRGRNLLHLCCGVDIDKKRIDPKRGIRMVDSLLAKGFGIDEPAFTEGAWHATALWYAIARGRNRRLAEHLLELGCDPNHCLWAAAFRDDLAVIGLLLDHGAAIDAVAEDETPFLAAVKVSRFRAAEMLLARGANVDFQDSSGNSALHYMLKKGSDKRHFRMVMRFAPRGDLENGKGETAAAVMARKRDPEFKRMARALAARA